MGGWPIAEITRRNFLKLVGALGTGLFVQKYRSGLLDVFAQAADSGVKLVWMQGQGDTACSISLLQGVHPDLYDAVQTLNVVPAFHHTLMPPFGEEAMEILDSVVPDILVLEGAIPSEEMKGACIVGERNAEPVYLNDELRRLSALNPDAVHIAVGACATHGGIPGARGNVTGAMGLKDLLPDRTVVNLPGCPPQGEHILLTAAAVILGTPLELDDQGRPKAFYGMLVHDECPRRGFYDEGRFAGAFGDLECLYQLGCRGPVTFADCASRRWNGGVNFCMQAGAPCIGCFDLRFPDAFTPFYESEGILELDATKKAFQALIAGTMAAGATYIGLDILGKRKRKGGKGGGE
jgi:hydrogenase small subunit